MRLHHHTTCVRLMSSWNPELLQVWQALEIHQVPELSNKFRSVVFLAFIPLLYRFNLIRSTLATRCGRKVHSSSWPVWRQKCRMVVYLAQTPSSYVRQLTQTLLSNMTSVSNDPMLWPLIDSYRLLSYFLVASFAAVIYDWALTFGQEFELIWRQPWSHMTILYLSVRYAGLPYAVAVVLSSIPSVSVSDAGCNVMYFMQNWMTVAIIAILCVIVNSRLHAMYQRSRKMLIFLVTICLSVTIACVVLAAIVSSHVSGEELVLSGCYLCHYNFEGVDELLISMTWILCTVWEVSILCLAVWIVVKHFREVQQLSTGGTITNCFMVLTKIHMIYFIFSVIVFSFGLGSFSPTIYNSSSVGAEVYNGVLEILLFVQMFVLGPRLILGVREHDAKLAVNSDAGPSFTTIIFQERGLVSTGSGV